MLEPKQGTTHCAGPKTLRRRSENPNFENQDVYVHRNLERLEDDQLRREIGAMLFYLWTVI